MGHSSAFNSGADHAMKAPRRSPSRVFFLRMKFMVSPFLVLRLKRLLRASRCGSLGFRTKRFQEARPLSRRRPAQASVPIGDQVTQIFLERVELFPPVLDVGAFLAARRPKRTTTL